MPTDKEVTASQFPEVYSNLGIDPGKLGCIMLDTEPIEVSSVILYKDLYFADPSKHKWIQGIVSENVPHVTLLYGLLRSGTELKKHVDAVLDGWTPEDPTIAEISFFPSSDPGESYVTLVAKLDISPNLLEANSRLKLLPHIDTFPDYKPHITLAYVNDSCDYQTYIRILNHVFRGKVIGATGLNYGD